MHSKNVRSRDTYGWNMSAPADGPKSERKVCVLRIDFFRARKWPTITASDLANALTAWDTQRNTQYHTPDANMTSLSIRLTVPLREVIIRDALAQRTAFARASREHHVHSPCRYAIEACCSLCFVAKLASHCSHRTRAKAHTRAHVSIIIPCSNAWLQAGMQGLDTNGVQRE